MVDEYNITGKVLILFNLNDIADPQILPFPGDKPNPTQKLDLTLILLLITPPPLQVFNKILDHRHQHQHKKRHEDGRLASGQRYRRDGLQRANQQEVDYITSCITIGGFGELIDDVEWQEREVIILGGLYLVIRDVVVRHIRVNGPIQQLSIIYLPLTDLLPPFLGSDVIVLFRLGLLLHLCQNIYIVTI